MDSKNILRSNVFRNSMNLIQGKPKQIHTKTIANPWKLKTKETNLTTARETMYHLLRNTNSNDRRFCIWKHGGQREGARFSNAERKELSTMNTRIQILYLVKLPFRSEKEIRKFSDEGKLWEFIASWPLLKEWPKERKSNSSFRCLCLMSDLNLTNTKISKVKQSMFPDSNNQTKRQLENLQNSMYLNNLRVKEEISKEIEKAPKLS